jgi:hypothetical protein
MSKIVNCIVGCKLRIFMETNVVTWLLILGLQVAHTQLFSPVYGGARPGVKKLAFILTDGRQTSVNGVQVNVFLNRSLDLGTLLLNLLCSLSLIGHFEYLNLKNPRVFWKFWSKFWKMLSSIFQTICDSKEMRRYLRK